MNTDEAKRLLVEYGWNADERAIVGRMLRTIEEDAESRRAADEYDLIRAALRGEIGAQDVATDVHNRLADAVRGFAPPRRAVLWRWISIAAAVALAFVGGWALRGGPGIGSAAMPTKSIATARLIPTPQEARAFLSLFDELSGVYEHRTGWVLLSGGRAEFGLKAAPGSHATAPIVLRLSALGGERLISTADLVIQPGQNAETVLPLPDGLCLRISVAAGAGAAIEPSIRAEIYSTQGSSRTTHALLTSSLTLAPGQSRSAGRVETETGEIEIRVAAAPGERGA